MTCQWLELRGHLDRKHTETSSWWYWHRLAVAILRMSLRIGIHHISRENTVFQQKDLQLLKNPQNMEVVTLEIALRSSCAGSACGTESQSTFVRPKILRVCILRPSPRPRKQFSGWFNPIYPYLFTMGQAIVLLFCSGRSFSVQTLHRRTTPLQDVSAPQFPQTLEAKASWFMTAWSPNDRISWFL